MAGGPSDGSTYSKKTAFVYIFNLIVGVGALALPYGFSKAGLVLGLLFLAAIGFLAFITTTWLIEGLSIANFILVNKKSEKIIGDEDDNRKQQQQKRPIPNENDSLINSEYSDNRILQANVEDRYLLESNCNNEFTEQFEIKKRVEVGEMSKMFLGNIGYKVFYGVLIIYLFGDLSIYAATVPTTLANVTGGWGKFTDYSVYYFYLFLFACFVGPFSLFNFQKTKYLQFATLITRNVAFLLMIILSIIFIAQGNGASIKQVPMFNISELASIFGVSIYSFMTHHSIPGFLTPISKKDRLFTLMGLDFILVFIAYGTLCVVSLFAFGSVTNPTCATSSTSIHTFIPCQIQSLYIYNFTSYNNKFISDFLSLFPVFTLSTNYILISITLRNNLLQLITWKQDKISPFVRNVIFSLTSSLIPVGVAFCTRNVSLLVNITGSYAGLGIMFVMPALISFYSNKMLTEYYHISNPKKSPFSNKFFYLLILLISVICLVLATWKIIITYK
ncbi:hypothetical protein RB653_006484 [Dictyostelium firmibasis]|uniref:Amino acid transporter transmembrane domain-containing protein n=1 Tax=Dictyostelium firmibasis TaxID=79012 RepID=A0AAN7YZ52_9MYCE